MISYISVIILNIILIIQYNYYTFKCYDINFKYNNNNSSITIIIFNIVVIPNLTNNNKQINLYMF